VTVERLGETFVPPPNQRLTGERLAILASLAGVGAIVLGGVAMATTLRSGGGDEKSPATTTVSAPPAAPVHAAKTDTKADAANAAALSFLARPSTQRVPFANAGGRMVLAVAPNGRGVLVLRDMPHAPARASYVAWLVGRRGRVLGPTARFSGRDRIVRLSRFVPSGDAIAVTREFGAAKAGPTSKLRLVARRGGS